MEKKVYWAFLALFLVGCGTKMDVKKPIRIESELGERYTQDGEYLNHPDMLGKLRLNPAAAEELGGYEVARVTAGILGASGGFLIGWGAGEGFRTWEYFAIGGGLLLSSVLVHGVWAAPKVRRAVIIHNESLKKGAHILPWLRPEDGRASVGALLYVPVL